MSNQSRKISKFVLKAVEDHVKHIPVLALDIPSGFGRHTEWLSLLGVPVVSLEIDSTRAYASHQSGCVKLLDSGRGVVADATSVLPFCDAVFDLVIIVDFVNKYLLQNIYKYMKDDSVLIYESVRARGENWRELLPIGQTQEILSTTFSFLYLETKACGPTRNEAETVRVVALRLPSNWAIPAG